MTTTDYVSAVDGDKLVKAEAMNAAFQAYHQNYLDNAPSLDDIYTKEETDELIETRAWANPEAVNFSPFFDVPADDTNYWRLLTKGTIDDGWLVVDDNTDNLPVYISVLPHGFVSKHNYTLLVESRNVTGECTFKVHSGLANALLVQTPEALSLTNTLRIPLIGILNVPCTRLCEFELNVPSGGHAEIRLSVYEDTYEGDYVEYDEWAPAVVQARLKNDDFIIEKDEKALFEVLELVNTTKEKTNFIYNTVNAIGRGSYNIAGNENYLITFNKNSSDATGTMSAVRCIGGELYLPQCDYQYEGYTFLWWSTVTEEPEEWENGVNRFYAQGSYIFDSNITLYAWWGQNDYNLSVWYYGTNGINDYGVPILSNEKIEIENKDTFGDSYFGSNAEWKYLNNIAYDYCYKTSPGYGITGFYNNDEYSQYVHPQTKISDLDSNQDNIVKVSYGINGRSYTGNLILNNENSISAPYVQGNDHLSSIMGTPLQLYFDFNGWYSDKNGKGLKVTNDNGYFYNLVGGDFSILPLTFYADWSVREYTVSYRATDRVSTDIIIPDGISIYTDTDLCNGIIPPTKENYYFNCWRTKIRNAKTKRQQGTKVTAQHSIQSLNLASTNTTTVFLYAMYETTPLAISFNPNNESGETMQDQEFEIGVPVTLNPCTFTSPEGMAFVGWNTAADGSGISYTDEQTTTEYYGVFTLYAQWMEV